VFSSSCERAQRGLICRSVILLPDAIAVSAMGALASAEHPVAEDLRLRGGFHLKKLHRWDLRTGRGEGVGPTQRNKDQGNVEKAHDRTK
jgi:hypothetical protein